MLVMLHRRRRVRRAPRKSRAKPKSGWSLAQLAQLTGVSARTIKLYVERDLVPRPKFEASATRYQRRQLLWLLAVRRLRKTEDLELAAIKTRLHAMDAAALEAFAIADVEPGPIADALGLPAKPAEPADKPPQLRHLPHRTWTRLDLAIGLELHVREDATVPVLELAQRVWNLCVYGDPDRSAKAAPAPPTAPVLEASGQPGPKS